MAYTSRDGVDIFVLQEKCIFEFKFNQHIIYLIDVITNHIANTLPVIKQTRTLGERPNICICYTAFIKILVMTAFPLACPQKHKIRNNKNKNDEKNVCPWAKRHNYGTINFAKEHNWHNLGRGPSKQFLDKIWLHFIQLFKWRPIWPSISWEDKHVKGSRMTDDGRQLVRKALKQLITV